MVYEFINDHTSAVDENGPATKASASATRRGRSSPRRSAPLPASPGSQSTLKDGDLEPAWQGPVPARTEKVPLPRKAPFRKVWSSRVAFFFDRAPMPALYKGHVPTTQLIGEIIENFDLLEEWDDRYRYLIELGRTLEPLPDATRNAANKVQGCASQAWLSTVGQASNGAARARC